MKTQSIPRNLILMLVAWSLLASWATAQRMPQDSWYLKKTVETGMFIGGGAIDADGNIYISDAKLGLIKKFSPTYQLLQTWGGLGTGDGQFGTISFQDAVRFRDWSHIGAGGLCFTAAQELVVCDPANHRVQVFSRTGTFLRKFGSQGTGNGQFNSPVAAAVSADGTIYVADRDNHRIQVFSAAGTFLSKFGSQGGFDGQLKTPTGLAVMSGENLAVADAGNRRIQVFTPGGSYVSKLANKDVRALCSFPDGALVMGTTYGPVVAAEDGAWDKSFASGKVRAWGSNSSGQINIPADLGAVVALAAGGSYTVALQSDGIVRAWGLNGMGQINVPADLGSVVAIAAGNNHTVALQSDGVVRAWGQSGSGQTNVPADLGSVVAIAAGNNYSVALQSDGVVRAWGSNSNGAITIPADLGPVVAIAAGNNHTVALQADGVVRAWGNNGTGPAAVPAGLGPVAAIAAGNGYTLALLADGSIRQWGSLASNPVGNGTVSRLATGCSAFHAMVVDSNGKVWAWGQNGSGQINVPTDLAAVSSLAVGGSHSVVVEGETGVSQVCAEPEGGILICSEKGTLRHYARTFRTILPESPNSIPLPVVISSSQRPGTSLVDIDFRVDDADDATVEVAALAFRNGGNTLADVIPIKTLAEGTANKLGAGVATGQVHRLTWDAQADVTGNFEQVQIEILAKDGRGLFNLDYIQIPAEGALPGLKISKTPLKGADFHAAWLWLIATGDPEIAFANGKVTRLSDAALLASSPRWLAWNITQSADGGSFAMSSEFELYNGAVVVPMTGATVTGSGSPNNLKDGSLTTEWQSSSSGAKRLVFQFPAAVEFDGYRFATGGIPNWRPVSWSLQTSHDGVNWTTVDTKTNATVPSASRTWTDIFKLGSSLSPELGRAFLLARMGLREATPAEVLRAQEAGMPGVITQWTPPLQVGPGERPVKVNSYGFETGDTGTWVVPITP